MQYPLDDFERRKIKIIKIFFAIAALIVFETIILLFKGC
jgi:hypothetical protein